jgi:T-complex protein 1 subunit theta
LERVLVTSDAATICSELEVAHPAAKMLVMASAEQQKAYGDGSNFVVSVAGELLSQAQELLRKGVHPADIVVGYRMAAKHAQEALAKCVCEELGPDDLRDAEKLAEPLTSVIAAKHLGFEHIVAPLVAEACTMVMPPHPRRPVVKVDNVRTAKLIGGSITDSQVIRGLVILRDTEGTVKFANKAKVAVYGVGIEAADTETKGTVVLKSAEELKAFSRSEEAMMEEAIKGLADAGVKVAISGGSISEIAMHFLEKYEIMVLKIMSKFELRRICSATGATALVRLGVPTEEEMGYVDSISVQELSSRRVTVLTQEDEDSKIATIVMRGATSSLLDDLERAVDDAVHTAKTLCKDGRLTPGAGATETAMSLSVQEFAKGIPGLEQYAINKYAEALEVVPKTLAGNAGKDSTDALSSLYAAHTEGAVGTGVDIETGGIKDAIEARILDAYLTKANALRLASDAAITVLRVDQIIMSKQAGGPKPREMQAPDA